MAQDSSERSVGSRRAVVIVAVVVLLALVATLWLLPDRNGAPAVDGAVTDSRVRVTSPRPNAIVSSPLTVRGEARGQWYFEADFPVRLVDETGAEVASAVAPARGEWMTEEFVPFEVSLTFEEPATGTALLVLDRSNPSGLAENAAQVAIPVRFRESAPAKRALLVFFNSTASGDDRCEAVWPVPRAAEPSTDPARAALTQLVGGPTAAERNRGYLTNIPPGVGIRSLRIDSDTAYADFDSTLNRVAGSCRVMAIRSQIEETLLWLPGIEAVVISVEGDVATALQP